LVPALSTAGMCVALYLVLSNFTMVTDKSLLVSAMLASVPVIALVVGLCSRMSSRLVAASSAEDGSRNG
jgi:hypothetical protein